tara:strand:+ start:525 stop:749 length:225 start_codon:yes stop_codon:yes gene_type:complete
MKIGDLVELSAYGENIISNIRYQNQLGIVHFVRSDQASRPTIYYKVFWFGNRRYKHKTNNHPRRDLKHIKAKKS